MKKYIPHIIWCIIIFYLVPLIVEQIPLISGLPEMFTMIFNIVFLVLGCIFFGGFCGFKLLLPLITALVFLPYGLLYYTPARTVFTLVVYFFTTIIGNLTGLMFKKNKN